MFARNSTITVLAAFLLLTGFASGMWYQGFRSRHDGDDERIALQEAAALSGTDLEAVAADGDGAPEPEEIVVYVTGAVVYPQVYKMAAGSRVYEATQLAVLLAEAETMGLDMARLLADEETVIVPYRVGAADAAAALAVEQALAAAETSGGGGHGGKVNINTASTAELDTLPGIGPVLAQRIVDYRERHGKFQEVSELLEVSGIGDQRLADIEPHISL